RLVFRGIKGTVLHSTRETLKTYPAGDTGTQCLRCDRIDALSFRIQARPRYPARPAPIHWDLGNEKLRCQHLDEMYIQGLRSCSYVAADPDNVEIYARRRVPYSNRVRWFLERIRRASDVGAYGRVSAYSRRRLREDRVLESNGEDSFCETIPIMSNVNDAVSDAGMFSHRWGANCGDSFLDCIRSLSEEVDPEGAEWVTFD
ncbi:hypothetical protein B0H11DRAFT_2113293, partial [Mycena galericulata]